MKPIKATLILVLLISLCQIGNAQRKTSSVKIYLTEDANSRAQLLDMLQIDHFYEEDGAIISEINEGYLKKLKFSGYRYEVLVDDVGARVNELNRKYIEDRQAGRIAIEQQGSSVDNIIPQPAAFTVNPAVFGGYLSFAQMEAAMDALVLAYPNIASKTSLGKSIENRDIWCIKISDNISGPDDANEPDVLYVGLQHAREAITGASMIFFMQYLAEQYSLDPKVKDLVDNREIYIIPCMNPDGWEYNRLNGGVGMDQRKNRRNVGTDGASTQKGVDLNRNWGVDWGDCNAPILGPASSCGSSSATMDTYWGTAAFSEPETNAIKNLVIAKNFVAAIDQHAYGPYYSLPFGRRSKHTMTAADQNFYMYVPAIMGQYNGMRANDSYGALGYEVAGGFKDWMLLGDIGTGTKGKVFGMTGEGSAGGGVSGNSFWAPASQIVNLCRSMCFQNLQLAFAAGSYVDLQDASDIAVASKTGSFNFNLRRVGIGTGTVTVSLVPMGNIQAVGAPVVISAASLPNYYDTYAGSISYTLPAALVNEQRIKFAWKVETGGNTYYDTIVKFYNPVTLFSDNMEGSFGTNWTNTATGSPASGFGYNYTSGNWVFTTSGGYNSTKALSESAAGTNYGSRARRVVQYNSTLALGNATAAYLSFWTRHRIENFRDKVRVEVSPDGTNWTAIAGTTTIQEPGTLDGSTIGGIPSLTGIRDNWTHELFNLSAYNGQANLRLRFIFTSDNDPTTFVGEVDEGIFIDDVKIIKSTVSLNTLPVHFLSFAGRLQQDESVRLDWDAQILSGHDYFEVEKSSDGINFVSIGRGPSSAPYYKIDRSPYIGNNYYRVKQVDVDNKIAYSTVVNVVYNPWKLHVSVYPNPVKDVLTVKINSTKNDTYTILIADLSGRKVYEQKITTTATTREVNINMSNEATQMYILTVRNSRNEIVSTEKIAKH